MIEFELDSDFMLVVKILMSGILSIKINSKKNKSEDENEEEENQLLVQLFYSFHFHRDDSLDLDPRTSLMWKNFSKIPIQSKDITQSLQLIGIKNTKKQRKKNLF